MKRLLQNAIPVLVIIIIILAYLLVTKDIQQESYDKDLETITQLDSIQNEITVFYNDQGTLPETLALLNEEFQKFDYEITGETKYQLCTNFDADINDEVLEKSPIRVNYEEGYDCITFNVDTNTEDDAATDEVKPPQKIINDIDTITINNPIDTSTQNTIDYTFDTSKSYLSKIDDLDTYLLNLYTTVRSEQLCTSITSPEDNCCYSLNKVTLETAEGLKATYNNPTSGEYIKPIKNLEYESYGELPTNLCFHDSNEYSGMISFSFPSSMLEIGKQTKMLFNNHNQGQSIEINLDL